MGYSIKHKMLILQKVLPPNNRPVHEVSKESGISVQTIYKWMQQVKDDTLEPGTPEDQPLLLLKKKGRKNDKSIVINRWNFI
jgi:transposase-like protein